MGGDFAPREPVAGAVRAARAGGAGIILVGRQADIEAELAGKQPARARSRRARRPRCHRHGRAVARRDIEHQPGRLHRPRSGPGPPRRGRGLRHHGPHRRGAGRRDVRLGRLRGVCAAGLASPFPTVSGRCVIIDIGANAEVRAGLPGAVRADGRGPTPERVLGIAVPRVGLVSNGEERGKGSGGRPGGRAADRGQRRCASSATSRGGTSRFGAADVVVTDGFTGNVLLKFAEGMPQLVGAILRDALAGDPLAVPTGLLLRRAMRRARPKIRLPVHRRRGPARGARCGRHRSRALRRRGGRHGDRAGGASGDGRSGRGDRGRRGARGRLA